MKRLISLYTILGALVAFSGLLVGCSDDEPQGSGTVTKVAQVVAESLVTQVVEGSRQGPTVAAADASEISPDSSAQQEPIVTPANQFESDRVNEDLLVIGTSMFAVSADGLLIYDFVSRTYDFVPSATPLTSIASHAGRVYVGGDELYVFNDGSLTPVEISLPGPVTALAGFDHRLLIGTESGLYATSLFGDDLLLADYAVSELTASETEAWVGTTGDGLFQFDGVEFRPRYLARDKALMSFVTALGFAHGHLYVGTDNGLFIYDGGSWQQLTKEDGLPSNSVTDIDASYWVVAIGTDAGLTTWFDGDFIPVESLNATPVVSVARYDSRIIVGTAVRELLVKSGPAVRPLIPNYQDSLKQILSVLR